MTVQQFPAGGGAINISAGASTNHLSSLVFSNSNSVSFGLSGSTLTASVGAAPSPVNFSAGAASGNLGSVVFSNSNNMSFGLNGSTITGSFNSTLLLGTGATASFVQEWALAGAQTAGTTSSAQGTRLFLSGGNMMTLSGSSNTIVFSMNSASLLGTGATASLRFTSADTQLRFTSADTQLRFTSADTQLRFTSADSQLRFTSADSQLRFTSADSQLVFTSATSSQRTFLSSYENMNNGLAGSSVLTFNGVSLSHAQAFQLPQFVSASFMRIPALMTLQSTTLGTLNSATASAQGGLFSTWNAVVYSMGVGANSKSLQSVTSSSNQWSFTQKLSMSNTSQGSYSLGYSANALGGGLSLSTQYSLSDANSYVFSTNPFTDFSSNRMLDIQWANSLSPGNYWLVIGYSSSSSSAGAGLGGITNCFIKYSNHYGISNADLSFGQLGTANQTSGGLMGAGSFSTAGGGTTNSIPISAISSNSNNARIYFQLLRSA